MCFIRLELFNRCECTNQWPKRVGWTVDLHYADVLLTSTKGLTSSWWLQTFWSNKRQTISNNSIILLIWIWLGCKINTLRHIHIALQWLKKQSLQKIGNPLVSLLLTAWFSHSDNAAYHPRACSLPSLIWTWHTGFVAFVMAPISKNHVLSIVLGFVWGTCNQTDAIVYQSFRYFCLIGPKPYRSCLFLIIQYMTLEYFIKRSAHSNSAVGYVTEQHDIQ